MNLIVPIILIASSFAVFFGYVDPTYKNGVDQTNSLDYSKSDVVFLRSELANYEKVLNTATQITAQRDVLVAKKNTISETDKARLEKLLPNNIDNIRLIIEISKMAESRNLVAKNISVGDMTKTTTGSIGENSSKYGTLSMKFTVTSSYNNFLAFLGDLEKNLRLLDITNISFSATESGFYDFNVSLDTYWLK